MDILCRYIHADVDTLERVEILRDLRMGTFDVLIGVNLLREGLDLPEVSLVAILDADKEGFLRSERSLTQIAGRAARHLDSMVIMYADKITDSMRRTIDETSRRRERQIKYNLENNITPTQIFKSTESIMGQTAVADSKSRVARSYVEKSHVDIAADPVIRYMTTEQLQKALQQTKRNMEKAAKELDFMEAARLRDEMLALEMMLKK
jgi:excinuclease ABC subunit B